MKKHTKRSLTKISPLRFALTEEAHLPCKLTAITRMAFLRPLAQLTTLSKPHLFSRSINTRTLTKTSKHLSPTLSTQTPLPRKSTQPTATMYACRIAQFLAIGYSSFGHRGYAANKAYFTPNALDVDLSGKHFIVTGATSGLGKVTAQALAQRGGNVHLLVRDAGRGENVRQHIVTETGNENVSVHICDISKLSDIDTFSRQWIKSGRPISALVNNAGAMVHNRVQSADGLEVGFATNTLGTFALTEMLRPALESAADARVVTVSSGGMLTEALEVDDFEGTDLWKGKKIDGSAQYSRSKRHQVAMTEYWARRYSNKGIFWASMHPGWAGTPGLQSSMPDFYNFTKNQLRSEEAGADTIIYLAASEEPLKMKSGEFFFDRQPSFKHLTFAGTKYEDGTVDKLMGRLKGIVEGKGFSLPE